MTDYAIDFDTGVSKRAIDRSNEAAALETASESLRWRVTNLISHTVALTETVIKANAGGLGYNDIPDVLQTIYAALDGLGRPAIPAAQPAPKVEPLTAKEIAAAVQPDSIMCFEDGKRYKSMKRHLRVHFNLTPAEYRAKWGLPDSFPMTAPDYSARRSELAKANGLGRK